MYVVNEEADDNLFILLRVGVEHSYTLNSEHFLIFSGSGSKYIVFGSTTFLERNIQAKNIYLAVRALKKNSKILI